MIISFDDEKFVDRQMDLVTEEKSIIYGTCSFINNGGRCNGFVEKLEKKNI